jgi:3-dehydroquinate synthetase
MIQLREPRLILLSSSITIGCCSEETNPTAHSVKLAPSVIDSWQSLEPEVRAALVELELLSQNKSLTGTTASFSSSSNDATSDSSEQTSCDNNKEADVTEPITIIERDAVTSSEFIMKPLERAPKNVFSFSKTSVKETTEVTKTAAALVTRKTSIVTRTRGWRNVFTLPISYDVNLIPYGTILDPSNPQLLDATGPHHKNNVMEDEKVYNRRFAVIDDAIEKLFGTQIRHYFATHGIALTTCVLSGGEADKRPAAVDQLIDSLCQYKLRRREPFLAIGGGVLLDIAGMAACLYRRGVPFVRVPTTLLAIVDASVGVKNGVDYCCGVTDETYKNRVGSFYPPSSCLLDPSFITTQDERNVCNGFGEIIKLALVRSEDLFELLETYGMDLVRSRFAPTDTVPEEVTTRVIDLSIQIMLEELGPNLWETKLERCVDYGHTFSKLLEMVPGADILHGEAVNVDGFFCCILSYLRGYIAMETVQRIFNCMKSLHLPTHSVHLQSTLAWQSCKDAVEHRHGEQRIPLITDIGESLCVSDITPEELDRALEVMKQFDH